MKKKTLVALTLIAILSITGCAATQNTADSNVDEKATSTTETKDENVTPTEAEKNNSDEEPQLESETSEDFDEISDDFDDQGDNEIYYQTVESEAGYKVTFNPEYFVYDESGEYEGKESIYIRCTVDEENEYENFIDVQAIDNYTAEELIDGLALQNDTEAVPMHISLANGEYDAFYCDKMVADAFLLSYYVIPTEDNLYLVEVGDHIYSDEDEYAYKVSGIMEEAFLSLEFK